ncbi:MAG TPA: DUF2183 domain-containing protein [Candidatus Rifleibacterium sp.]|nr:DUF2183 domain-containing protein [Candidatus Rifleibacterium sp.]HPT45645.1 DUF2183 domain-containing protein [Candidatus Rifleibacterium sp.]
MLEKRYRATLLTVALVLFAITSLQAADLYDLRVFPYPASQTISLAGYVSGADPWQDPTSKRARASGMLRSWLANGQLSIETEGASCTASVADGEFSATLPVLSIASFSLRVSYENELLYLGRYTFPEKIEMLVISDVDDTILITEVTSRTRMVINSMFKSVTDRLPVSGTPEFYRDMFSSLAGGTPHFVYLSSSPAFLSRPLKTFLMQNEFPPGTLILKKSLTEGSHHNHKSGWLRQLSGEYPGIPMLLLGDSGEQDPAIYSEFVESSSHPQNIKAVIIHDISETAEDSEALQQYAGRLERLEVPFITWKNIADLRLNLIRLAILLDKNG